MALPDWARRLVDLYESNASNQFLVYGNVEDRFLIPGPPPRLATLNEFFLEMLLPGFAVVLSYDLGNGIRVEKGGSIFASWPALKDASPLPKQPRPAIEYLTQYFRYCANLRRLQRESIQVGLLLKYANLVAPATGGSVDHELGAIITLIRDWSIDNLLTGHPLATFIFAENVSDVHPLLSRNPRCQHIQIPLPSTAEIDAAFEILKDRYPVTLGESKERREEIARALTGATLTAAESLLKELEHTRKSPTADDLVAVKKQIVQTESQGLIEFVESRRTLDAIQGHDAVKIWLRQDIALWNSGDVEALPKGYLISGPVGTGKSFLVECLAGEAAVPMVKLKNFRDRWVGSTEGNLERIFRLLRALGRCYVFIDEADQALGKRESGSDSGVSGRVYSMIAEEMSSPHNRGRILWVLASSRPDLIEVDLKRPGRVDVKIPLFPTANARESFELIQFLCRSRGIVFPRESLELLGPMLPDWLTAGAAETLAVKVYRETKTRHSSPVEALVSSLEDYRPPVPREILAFQMQLAIAEASDQSFVPSHFVLKEIVP
jgi:ATPase family associated with various cellular activities (AAA)